MEKLNIAELLKDCPTGMELECTNYSGIVTFEQITDNLTYPIKIIVKHGNEYSEHTLTKYGQTCKTPYNKCVIFPKGKTTWEGFQKPFKVGDTIRHKSNNGIYCKLGEYSEGISAYRTNIGLSLTEKDLEQWELAPNKFDITTLKPFDKVLVRTKSFTPVWTIDFYDGYQPNVGGSFTPFGVSGGKYFQQCIPYEGNEYLRGTTNDCEEFYKIW